MKNQTLEAAKRGKINPLEAVKLLDQEIGGITGAIWNPGRGDFKIVNHSQMIALPMRNSDNKEQYRLLEIAVLAYWQAQQNHSLRPGEVHIAKGISSKHYRQRFDAYLQALLTKYNAN